MIHLYKQIEITINPLCGQLTSVETFEDSTYEGLLEDVKVAQVNHLVIALDSQQHQLLIQVLLAEEGLEVRSKLRFIQKILVVHQVDAFPVLDSVNYRDSFKISGVKKLI